jgi:phosphate transport system protein
VSARVASSKALESPAERAVAKGRAKPKRKSRASGPQHELTALALKACLIARDAAYNIKDLLTNESRMAFLTLRDCEKELDQIERDIDERMPEAITRVNEDKARELLACLKFITDLERIGDLLLSVALHMQSPGVSPDEEETALMVEMATILHTMLDQVHEGFQKRDLECARAVLQADCKIDRICQAVFQRNLVEKRGQRDLSDFNVMLMAQALERAGDHTKNLAEELYGLIEGHTLRHPPKRRPAAG